MDADRFDALTRSLRAARPRRAVLGLTVAGLLGLGSPAGPRPARSAGGAGDRADPVGAARRGGASPSRTNGTGCGERWACAGGACRPAPPTCSDGVRNGDETDVDCGGSCPTRCANDRTCAGDGDCASGHCVTSACRECAIAAHCPNPSAQRCDGGRCCTVEGFEAQHACTDNGQGCSGNCATHAFGRTCRPAGCLPTGGDCAAGASVCCSFTCGGTTCQ